jgi:hypothetical protein
MASDGEPSEPASSRRAWQGQESVADADARASRRRFKIIVVTGVLSALAAMVVVFIRFIEPPALGPQFLAINVAHHNKKHFPLRAFAEADKELLMRHFTKKKDATTKDKEQLLAELKSLKDPAQYRSDEPLVIHLMAPALVRGETVYLLPVDAEPDNEETWLSVDVVLKSVEECPAKHKLLILDVAHGLVDPRLGVYADRVAEMLEARLTKEMPSFLVLCPCSSGQSSLTSEVLRSSVFAYYLDQGLVGEPDRDQIPSVSVRQLCQFVEAKVDRWARNNRGLRQVPRLFGEGDFILAPVGRLPLEKTEAVAPDPYPEALLETWKKRDAAWDRGDFHQASRPFLRLEANLLRDESRWRGGAGGKEFSLDQETRNVIDELEKIRRRRPRPGWFLS